MNHVLSGVRGVEDGEVAGAAGGDTGHPPGAEDTLPQTAGI